MHLAVTYRAAPQPQMQQPLVVERDKEPLLHLPASAAASTHHSGMLLSPALYSPPRAAYTSLAELTDRHRQALLLELPLDLSRYAVRAQPASCHGDKRLLLCKPANVRTAPSRTPVLQQ